MKRGRSVISEILKSPYLSRTLGDTSNMLEKYKCILIPLLHKAINTLPQNESVHKRYGE